MSTSDDTPDSPRDVTAAEAADALRAGSAILLDVRENDEWQAGHIPGAVHVPLSELDPATLNPSRPVIALCRSGGRSSKAVAALSAAGVPVRNLAGGMKDWAEQGLPVLTDSGRRGIVK